MAKIKEYTLVGVDGNAFAVMGYVIECIKQEGMSNRKDEYVSKATSGDYNRLLVVSLDYLEMCNKHMEKRMGKSRY